MMAKDKIRPAAIKVGIQLEPGQRVGFHNFRHSLATFAQLNLHRARVHRNHGRPNPFYRTRAELPASVHSLTENAHPLKH